ncbi:unnamed protein product [Allacma fusca]|uniref:Histone RNA hairpin-binding protein RNA-binding domain-containing protein n=1 Tax=Allacma fusca TaxID=39272 RepID=A0A8J2PLM2_9HEXA|nr:unnamed protein product [Allacma fusca]
MSSIPPRSSPSSEASKAVRDLEDLTSHLLPLSISLAVSSSSLASNTYNGDETDLFIPPGPSRANGYNIPKYPSQFRESNNYRDSQISPGHHSGQIETDPVVLARRQKQIDYGKNTQEYANYLKAIPM